MPHTIHLGWDAPALPRAADALVAHFGNDFDGVVIALPGARAGRRLEELLIARCATSWVPPRIATIGPITDALVRFRQPRAGGLTRELAWIEAAKHAMPAIAPSSRSAAPDGAAEREALAAQLRALHQELAAELIRFADVAAHPVLPTIERARWRALAAAQDAYSALLAECGLADPHLARLDALASGALLRAPRALVLVGVAAANGLQRELLRRADAQGIEILALVAAPAPEAAHFDAFGLLRTAAWKDRPVPLDDARWRVADRPADQAEEAVAFLEAACAGGLDGRATVAVLQDEVAPFLARRLAERGSALRPPVGRALTETAPGRLLDAMRVWLEGRAPRAYAALLRHPDLSAALAEGRDPGAESDEWMRERLPAVTDARTPRHEEVLRLAGALAAEAPLPFADWPRATSSFLRLLLRVCARDPLAPDPARRGLEQLGWLELPLDEAPALCVTGFQLGGAPEAVHGHAFLPESLRVALGLPSNDDRRARDVFALHVLAHARERLLFVSGQRGTAGDPWLPSPLVFQGADAPARVRAFFRAPEPRATASGGTTTPWTPPVAPPPQAMVAESFSASALNLYRRSPRLYWLQRVLGLETVEPEPHELDALRFGCFVHGVLERFHRHEPHHRLRTADPLAGAAIGILHEEARLRFGARPLATVRLQIAQLEGRLRGWAEAEAASRAEGWETIAVEWAVEKAEPVRVALDGEEFGLHGRLDRVDRRRRDGRIEIRVLDYKTGDQPTLAGKAFKPQAQRWEDLQLPIYQRLARARHSDAAAITTGWFNLPRSVEDTGIITPEWSADTLTLADEAIVAAVRGIRAGDFRELGHPDRRTLAPALLALLGEAPTLDGDDAQEEEEAAS